MGGLIVDILALASIAGFAWAGRQLGAAKAVVRLLAALGALGVALIAEPATSRLFQALTPWESFAVLLGLVLSSIVAYILFVRLLRPVNERLDPIRIGDKDQPIGMLAATFEGMGWALLMIGMLTLLPGDNIVSRSALDSRISKALTSVAPAAVQYPVDRMPSLAQTLPKGSRGAVLEADSPLPLRSPTTEAQPKSAGRLLATINGYRADRNAPILQFNRDIGQSMQGYARRMVRERFLDTQTPSGGKLDARVNSALGSQTAIYDPKRTSGIVVWAHSDANAYAALIADKDAQKVLADQLLTEVGVAAVDAGWFNGTFFVLGFVGPKIGAEDGGSLPEEDVSSDAFGDA